MGRWIARLGAPFEAGLPAGRLIRHSFLTFRVGAGTILLIDDEAPLRQAIARTLELEGYTVLQAPDAYRGLETLREAL